MGLFFIAERRQKSVPVAPPTVAEVEAALDALSQGKSTSVVGALLRSFDLAERLHAQCRTAEAALLAAVADGSVTTKAQAVACVKNATDGPFPAARFVDIVIANVGTWAATLQAAKDEAGG